LIGLTLVIDDLPDVSKSIESMLSRLKMVVIGKSQALECFQIVSGGIVFCFSVIIGVFLLGNPRFINVPTFILLLPMFLSSIVGLLLFRRHEWLKASERANGSKLDQKVKVLS